MKDLEGVKTPQFSPAQLASVSPAGKPTHKLGD